MSNEPWTVGGSGASVPTPDLSCLPSPTDGEGGSVGMSAFPSFTFSIHWDMMYRGFAYGEGYQYDCRTSPKYRSKNRANVT